MFREFYYWMCFYVRKVKINKEPEWNAYMLLSILRILNVLAIYGIIATIIPALMIKKVKSSPVNMIIICIIALIFNWIDWKLFFKKREQIFTRFNKLPKKERAQGKIKFWLYVVITMGVAFGFLPWLQGRWYW